MEFNFFSKNRSVTFVTMILASCFLFTICLPSSVVATNQQERQSISVENAPIYKLPTKNAEIRRREGGESRGTTRGLSRGLSRGLTRGLSRGLTRGLSRGLSRGLTRGLSRGLSRGLTRGAETEIISVPIPARMSPFASEHTGFTSDRQPTLRWYISDSWPGKIEFTLNETRVEEPVLETYIDGPTNEGVYQISLADYNITLKADVEYEWFLAIVPDPEERSADFLGSATIRYLAPSDELSERLSSTPKNKLYTVYAEKGYWYDAIDNLSRLIDTRPDDSILRTHRMRLLKQVNLPLAAAYDSKMLSK
ncbi:DUF928 domain-containing protein [Desulfonema magnum]|uniref:DUF928 n=1 Tax=Desulfonema magnum TaxID=45655 RepID=A0A975GT86_9BACT|nr:DUF928 domain-containing protein [Desulfonema magnum]QTA92819.1 DUF928 [Desulfonema magnum]